DAFERDWIHVPRVSGDVFDAANAAVARSVKPVVHTCPQTQCDELVVAVSLQQAFIVEEVFQLVRRALRLNGLVGVYGSERADNRVARTRDDARTGIDPAHAGAKFTDKAIANAFKVRGLGFFQPEIVEGIPYRHCDPGEAPVTNATEATYEERCVAS